MLICYFGKKQRMEIKSMGKTWHIRIRKSPQFKSYLKRIQMFLKSVFWLKSSLSLMENGTLLNSVLDANNFYSHQNAFFLTKTIIKKLIVRKLTLSLCFLSLFYVNILHGQVHLPGLSLSIVSLSPCSISVISRR